MVKKILELYTLKSASEATGIPVSALRREVHAGRLKCMRARPGRNAKILIHPDDLRRWLEVHASRRQFVSASHRPSNMTGGA